MTNIRIVAHHPITLPHRKLAAGEAIDFGRPDDLAFFVSRLRWSAFKIETVTSSVTTKAEIDATAHQALREAAEQIKTAMAENSNLRARIATLENEMEAKPPKAAKPRS